MLSYENDRGEHRGALPSRLEANKADVIESLVSQAAAVIHGAGEHESLEGGGAELYRENMRRYRRKAPRWESLPDQVRKRFIERAGATLGKPVTTEEARMQAKQAPVVAGEVEQMGLL